MAVVSVEYDDVADNEFVYEGVSLSYGNIERARFHTGIFVKDWYDCMKFIITGSLEEIVSHSSSVDHYMMDTHSVYDSAYLHITKDGTPVLKYEYSHDKPGIEFFVEHGTKPTWEELRKICGDEKKLN
jgi:hypothetical protein